MIPRSLKLYPFSGVAVTARSISRDSYARMPAPSHGSVVKARVGLHRIHDATLERRYDGGDLNLIIWDHETKDPEFGEQHDLIRGLAARLMRAAAPLEPIMTSLYLLTQYRPLISAWGSIRWIHEYQMSFICSFYPVECPPKKQWSPFIPLIVYFEQVFYSSYMIPDEPQKSRILTATSWPCSKSRALTQLSSRITIDLELAIYQFKFRYDIRSPLFINQYNGLDRWFTWQFQPFPVGRDDSSRYSKLLWY